MEFQPSDYLNDLNLVFDSAVVSPADEPISNSDLDAYQQAEFFDFDVFFDGVDNGLPQKAGKAKEEAYQKAMRTKHEAQNPVSVKEEPAEGVAHWASATASPAETVLQTDSDLSEDKKIDSDSSEDKKLESFAMKRKRNTAASARFRVKKKQKEMQMQQLAKDLQDKVNAYEKKCRSLEMENKCLKQLILEKNDRKHCDLLDSIKKRSLGQDSSASSFTFTN